MTIFGSIGNTLSSFFTPEENKYLKMANTIRSMIAKLADAPTIDRDSLNCIDGFITKLLNENNSINQAKFISDTINEIIQFLLLSLKDPSNLPFVLDKLEDLLDPGKSLYTSSLPSILPERLPFYYLFPGSSVLYKNMEYIVASVKQNKVVFCIPSSKHTKQEEVSFSDSNLSIPRNFFQSNFSLWVNSLQVGEVVDVHYVTTNNDGFWIRCVIRSIIRRDDNIEAIHVAFNRSFVTRCNQLSISEDGTYDYVITEFNEQTIGRPFSKSRQTSSHVVPLRYIFPTNILIPAVNEGKIAPSDHIVARYGCMIVSPIYLTMLNDVALSNMWYMLAQCLDNESDLNIDMLIRIYSLFCTTLPYYYQDSLQCLIQTLLSPLQKWILTLQHNNKINIHSDIASLIQYYDIFYYWTSLPLSVDIPTPSHFFIHIVCSLINDDMIQHVSASINLLERLYDKTDDNEDWKLNKNAIMISNFNYEDLATCLVSVDFFLQVMNNSHQDISSKAAMILAILCRHIPDHTMYIDTYWTEAMTQLQLGNDRPLLNLKDTLKKMPSSSISYIIDLIMNKACIDNQQKVIRLFIIALNELLNRNALTEEKINILLPFFSRTASYDWTKGVQIQIEKTIVKCIHHIHNQRELFDYAVENFKTNQNLKYNLLLIHSLLTDMNDFDYDFETLFTHLLHSIIPLLQKQQEENQSIIHSFVIVMVDTLKQTRSLTNNQEIIILWDYIWSIQNNLYLRDIIEFFSTSLIYISSDLFDKMIQTALASSYFFTCTDIKWTCACLIWKALNTESHRIEHSTDISQWNDTAILSEIQYPEFIIKSMMIAVPTIQKATIGLVEGILTNQTKDSSTILQIASTIITNSIETIHNQNNTDCTKQLSHLILCVLRCLHLRFLWRNPSLQTKPITIHCSVTDRDTRKAQEFDYHGYESDQLELVSAAIRQTFKKNSYILYSGSFNYTSGIDTRPLSYFRCTNGSTINAILVSERPSINYGLSIPTNRWTVNEAINKQLSELTLTITSQLCDYSNMMQTIDKNGESKIIFIDLMLQSYPIESIISLISSLITQKVDDYIPIITKNEGIFYYFVFFLQFFVKMMVDKEPLQLPVIITAFNTNNLPIALLNGLSQFNKKNSNTFAILPILQLLFEVYRPLFLSKPDYSSCFSYLRSYSYSQYKHNEKKTVFVDLFPMDKNQCNVEEWNYLIQFYTSYYSRLRQCLATSPISVDWLFEGKVGDETVFDYIFSILSQALLNQNAHVNDNELYFISYYSIRFLTIICLLFPMEPKTIGDHVKILLQLIQDCTWTEGMLSHTIELLGYSTIIFTHYSLSDYSNAIVSSSIELAMEKQLWNNMDSLIIQFISLLRPIVLKEAGLTDVLTILAQGKEFVQDYNLAFIEFVIQILCRQSIEIYTLSKDIQEFLQLVVSEAYNISFLDTTISKQTEFAMHFIASWAISNPSLLNSFMPIINELTDSLVSLSFYNKATDLFHINNTDTGEEAKYRGLYNLGATCYMNSVMQQLFHISTFSNAIIRTNWIDEETKTSPDAMTLIALQNFFIELSKKCNNPYDTTNWVHTFVKPNGSHLSAYEQEDAHEYLGDIFDKIETILKKSDHVDLLKELFYSKLNSIYTCPKCGAVIVREEDSICIGADVKGFSSLEDSLHSMRQPEYISDYRCASCNKCVTIQKTQCFASTAPYLFFQFKRFDFSNTTFLRYKITDLFSFPSELDLSPYFTEGVNQVMLYDIKGIIMHSGTVDEGHYISFIKNTDNEWWELNDSRVIKVDQDFLFERAYGDKNRYDTAYMVVYKRHDINEVPIVLSELERDSKIPAIKPILAYPPFWPILNCIFQCAKATENNSNMIILKEKLYSFLGECTLRLYPITLCNYKNVSMLKTEKELDWTLSDNIYYYNEEIYKSIRKVLATAIHDVDFSITVIIKVINDNYLMDPNLCLSNDDINSDMALIITECIDNILNSFITTSERKYSIIIVQFLKYLLVFDQKNMQIRSSSFIITLLSSLLKSSLIQLLIYHLDLMPVVLQIIIKTLQSTQDANLINPLNSLIQQSFCLIHTESHLSKLIEVIQTFCTVTGSNRPFIHRLLLSSSYQNQFLPEANLEEVLNAILFDDNEVSSYHLQENLQFIASSRLLISTDQYYEDYITNPEVVCALQKYCNLPSFSFLLDMYQESNERLVSWMVVIQNQFLNPSLITDDLILLFVLCYNTWYNKYPQLFDSFFTEDTSIVQCIINIKDLNQQLQVIDKFTLELVNNPSLQATFLAYGKSELKRVLDVMYENLDTTINKGQVQQCIRRLDTILQDINV